MPDEQPPLTRADLRRPSAAVYRRRRLALLIAVVVLALLAWLLIWLFVAQPWNANADDAKDASAPTPTATASVAPTPSADPTPSVDPAASPNPEVSAVPEAPVEPALAACTNAEITVEALTDKDAYAAGEMPLLSIRLTNTSAAPCSLNVGTTQQTFTISSGNDTWWRSTDCQSEPSDMEVTVAAGQVVESAAPLTWDRTRSSVSTCTADRPRAAGGGASYHLAVSIGGIESASTKQFILN